MQLLFRPEQVVDHQATGALAREKRKSLGLSFRRAAKALGMSKSNLIRLEQGQLRWDEDRVREFNEKLR